MTKNILIITLAILQITLISCEKIEYYDCKNNDEFFTFIENNNKECLENITSNIIDNTDGSHFYTCDYLTQISSIEDYTNSESDNFIIALPDKRIGKYTNDSIFDIGYTKNNILFSNINSITIKIFLLFS